MQAQQQDYCYYNPEVFIQLKAWLQWATETLPEKILNKQAFDISPLPQTLQTAATELALEQFIVHAKKQTLVAND